MFAIIFIIIIGFFWYVAMANTVYDIQKTVAKSSAAGYATYDANNSILKVEKRGSGLAKSISIEKHEIYSVSHKDEEYVYTGATVGNVTMGGVHKNEAYDYISGSTKTGKYRLVYAKENTIRTIALPDELYSRAKTSNIAQYLDSNSKSIIVVEKVKYSRMTQDVLLSGDINGAWMLGQREETSGFPTYEKCSAILNWLSSEY